MSHKCNCNDNNNHGTEGISGISPCFIIIGIVILGFLFCGQNRY